MTQKKVGNQNEIIKVEKLDNWGRDKVTRSIFNFKDTVKVSPAGS